MTDTRTLERELFIDAEPEIVWEAFTEARHIANWFAPEASSEPGRFIELHWDAIETPTHCHILAADDSRRAAAASRPARAAARSERAFGI